MYVKCVYFWILYRHMTEKYQIVNKLLAPRYFPDHELNENRNALTPILQSWTLFFDSNRNLFASSTRASQDAVAGTWTASARAVPLLTEDVYISHPAVVAAH
eukprot:Lankesteria_metandrocarpae@DN2928_c0_g1_i3.p1